MSATTRFRGGLRSDDVNYSPSETPFDDNHVSSAAATAMDHSGSLSSLCDARRCAHAAVMTRGKRPTERNIHDHIAVGCRTSEPPAISLSDGTDYRLRLELHGDDAKTQYNK